MKVSTHAFALFCLTALLALPAHGEPRFVDRAPALSTPHVYAGGWAHFVGGGVAVFDCDTDGRADLFVAGGTNPARLLRNVSPPGGDIAFADAALPTMRDVTGAYPLDLDGDARPDLMVLRNGANVLLRGVGDCRFEDATAALGLPGEARWTTAFAATWEAGARLPTLAIGNYVDASDPDGPFGTCDTNWLLRPEGPRYGAPIPLEPGYCALSMLLSDWRRDGTPMLRVSNDRHYYIREGYEQMWTLDPLRDLGPGDGWPRLQLWGMGIASRDLDADGLPEVMLTSMGDQVLMANDGAGFTPVPYATGTFAQRPFSGEDGRPSTGWHAEFGDVDNDGLADLFIAKGNVDQMPGMAMQDPNNLLIQRPDGRFVERADVAGVASPERSRGAALADLDNDGRLDLVVVNRRAPLEIWQNVTDPVGHWVQIDVAQGPPNTAAIGAFVEVRTGERVQVQEITVGGGHAGGSLLPRHFGLGRFETAEVRVVWPDGEAGPWRSVTVDRRLRIDRPERP